MQHLNNSLSAIEISLNVEKTKLVICKSQKKNSAEIKIKLSGRDYRKDYQAQ